MDHFVQAHGTAMGPKEYMHTDLAIREKELQDKFMDLINQSKNRDFVVNPQIA